MPGSRDTMKVYIQDIGHIPLLTIEEETDLAKQIANGSDEARSKLIRSNLRLVVKIAHDFKGLGLPLLDLISEGNIGLMRAVEKFDPGKGAKFSSYSAWWIKQAMRRALANQSRTIRIPVQSASKINRIKATRIRLAEKLGRDPTDNEIAETLDFSERTVSSLRRTDMKNLSLHETLQEGEDNRFEEVIADQNSIPPDRMLNRNEDMERLERFLARLDDRESRILRMRFGLDGTSPPRTLEEVSKAIGRTRERVRQIQNQALEKLRMMLEEDGLESND